MSDLEAQPFMALCFQYPSGARGSDERNDCGHCRESGPSVTGSRGRSGCRVRAGKRNDPSGLLPTKLVENRPALGRKPGGREVRCAITPPGRMGREIRRASPGCRSRPLTPGLERRAQLVHGAEQVHSDGRLAQAEEGGHLRRRAVVVVAQGEYGALPVG